MTPITKHKLTKHKITQPIYLGLYYLSIFIICGFLLYPEISLALPSDNKKPANIDANSALLNQKTGTYTFIGHVTVQQGTTKLSADKLIAYSSKQKKINKVIAYGKPAHYQTLPKPGEKRFYASANKIEYYATTGKVILIGHGKLKQGSSTFNAPYITYDRKKGIVTSKPGKQQRTTIIIQPSNLSKLNANSNQSKKS